MLVFRGEPGGQYDTHHYLVDDCGPVHVIDHNGNVTERMSLPTHAYELVTRWQFRDEILEALAEVTLSKAARAAVTDLIEGLAE